MSERERSKNIFKRGVEFFWGGHKRKRDMLTAAIRRDAAKFMSEAHQRVIVDLKQDRLDQERATSEGMPEK